LFEIEKLRLIAYLKKSKSRDAEMKSEKSLGHATNLVTAPKTLQIAY
jgi:hypothetical protein